MEESLEDRATEIVANGCGCDRFCQGLVGADVYCGCREDVTKIIELVVESMISLAKEEQRNNPLSVTYLGL